MAVRPCAPETKFARNSDSIGGGHRMGEEATRTGASCTVHARLGTRVRRGDCSSCHSWRRDDGVFALASCFLRVLLHIQTLRISFLCG